MERWPAAGAPRSLQYFCGVLRDDDVPPAPDPGYPRRRHNAVGALGRRFLADHGVRLWPGLGIAGRGSSPPFNWGKLHAEHAGDRFDQQFWRANIEPSERYAQSPAGSVDARPRPDATGVDGLLVIGDWTRTGLDYGCIEAATMSGLAAARAICGSPASIYGETDFPPFSGPGP
jgi:hypothetical protein